MESSLIINGLQLKGMLLSGAYWLKAHATQVNALNVFPVPDGDTGTNMLLTMQAALQDIHSYSDSHVGHLSQLASQGALMGARGNSGVILSQILDGFAQKLKNKESITINEFAIALESASDRAYQAVINPVEGTILTVMKEAARVSKEVASHTSTVDEFLTQVVEVAKTTLRLTPELLPILKESGVVDAGGQGLVYILEGMLRYTRGFPIEESDADGIIATDFQYSTDWYDEEPNFGYDVQFLVKGDNLDVEAIRKMIVSMGECPLVVGNQNTVKVHVHVPDPGIPLSYGVTQGDLLDIVVENMEEQHRQFVQERTQKQTESYTHTAMICVAPSAGLGTIFESLGADEIISGGQTMNPSIQEFVDVINRLQAKQFIILPNNSNIILTAEQATQLLPNKIIQIVPTKTIPQGISALLAFQANDSLKSNFGRMLEAMNYTQTIEVTKAIRTTTVNDVIVSIGDFIGLLNGDLVKAGHEPPQIVVDVFAMLDMDEYEIVTIYYGEDASANSAKAIPDLLLDKYSHLEFEIMNGGQPHYHYIISIE